ncbi:MAG: hypothetical protein JOZ55_01520 [Alphaproteobacteria bacterium]|nr:hypothetical protein [Alphaproteobacteria bacterium]
MTKLYAAALAGTLALITALPQARAADPAFCKAYAVAALRQVHAALDNPRCRYHLRGPRWSTDYRVHFDWCRSVPPVIAVSERDARTRRLARCRES